MSLSKWILGTLPSIKPLCDCWQCLFPLGLLQTTGSSQFSFSTLPGQGRSAAMPMPGLRPQPTGTRGPGEALAHDVDASATELEEPLLSIDYPSWVPQVTGPIYGHLNPASHGMNGIECLLLLNRSPGGPFLGLLSHAFSDVSSTSNRPHLHAPPRPHRRSAVAVRSGASECACLGGQTPGDAMASPRDRFGICGVHQSEYFHQPTGFHLVSCKG